MFDDLGGDFDLTTHGVDGDEGAFELFLLGQMIEQDGDSRDLVGLLRHADLRQRQMGVGRVGAERVQRFEALSFVVRAERGLAVDGDEDVPTRPQRVNPILEASCECLRIDPVHQRAQPALAGDPIVIRREFSQEVEMVFAPGGDLVEIVARGDGGAGQQQQDLGQRVDDPPRLALVSSLENASAVELREPWAGPRRPKSRLSCPSGVPK